MAWPPRTGRRTGELRPAARRAKRTAGAVGSERSQRLKRAAAIANLALLAGAITGLPTGGGEGMALASLVPGVSHQGVLGLLVGSSTLASLLLLLPLDGQRDQPAQPAQPESRAAVVPAQAPAAVGGPGFDGMVATMGHDLRTPLNAIIGFSDMMQQELHGPLGSDRYQSYATHIRDSGIALLGAIETTLAVTERLSTSHAGHGEASDAARHIQP